MSIQVSKDNGHYKIIAKGLIFFGSIQIVQTLIGLIKVKYVSVLIGPSGMGELTLFTTFSNTIVYVVGFGLFNSAVRNISIANGEGNLIEVQKIFSLVNKIIILTSIVGCAFLIIFRTPIERFLLGENSQGLYNLNLLVLVIFFSVLSNRNNMLIQGVGRYKKLGKATLISSLLSLVAVFPLFYFYGKEAIITSLIVSSFIIYLVSNYYLKSLSIPLKFDLNFKNLFEDSSQLIKLGIIMMLSSLLGNLVTNFINIYIVKKGSTFDLGLYNAATTISMQYVSLVFVSLSTEFYPRLSSVSQDYSMVRNMVNNQIEVVLVVLLPLLVLMQTFANFMVKIFFTDDFVSIVPFIQISTIAIIFQALAYVISNIPLAMGNKKYLFLYNSFIPGLISLSSSVLGYKYFGLMGLAFALFIVNLVHFLTMYIAVKKSYSFFIYSHILKLIMSILLILTASLFFIFILNGLISYLVSFFIVCFTFILTYKKCTQLFGLSLATIYSSLSEFNLKNKL